MPIRPGDYWRRLRWVTKTFYVLALVYAILYITRLVLTLQSLILLGAVFFGLLSLVGLVRRSLRKAIWRLRNRLILAYLMIAVVPIVLGLVLVGIASWAVIGQMAVYLVDSELKRRISFLTGPVEGLLRMPGNNADAFAAQLAPIIERRFPVFQLRVQGRSDVRYPPGSELDAPPSAWTETSGLMVRKVSDEAQLYAWVHAKANGN